MTLQTDRLEFGLTVSVAGMRQPGWIDTGSGPGWAHGDEPQATNTTTSTEPTKPSGEGTAWERHDDPELNWAGPGRRV